MKKIIFTTLIFTFLASLTLGFFTRDSCGSDDLNIVDKNQNGIWDDLDLAIEKASVNPIHRKALEQFIKGAQEVLLNPSIGLKERNEKYISSFDRGSSCVRLIEKKLKIPFHTDLQDAFTNSYARLSAYAKYNSNLSGGVYSLWDEEKQGNPCDFEWNK